MWPPSLLRCGSVCVYVCMCVSVRVRACDRASVYVRVCGCVFGCCPSAWLALALAAATGEKDAGGNPKLADSAQFLVKEIQKHFKSKSFIVNVKYIDPSYLIRRCGRRCVALAVTLRPLREACVCCCSCCAVLFAFK